MLTKEENALLTQTGPGAPAGDLMRRYWQPAALSEELPPGGPPVPIRLLSEDLVLFRDDQGRPGLLGIHCSHRGADLSYGRLEDGGIRCIYHGWLYDISGRCLEQPGEPAGSTFHERIRQPSYPCQERGGVIFTYMGPGEPPLLPNYEFLNAPAQQTLIYKYHQDCNYLQGNEGNLDPVHNNLLHHPNVNLAHVKQADNFVKFRGGRGAVPAGQTLEIEVEDFGIALCDITELDDDQKNIRTYDFVMPNLTCFPGRQGNGGYSVHWHVPIDDHQHWKYSWLFNRTKTLEEINADPAPELGPGYRILQNKENRFMQDRSTMSWASYSGLSDFPSQDSCAIVGMGPVQDRTEEHLAASDKVIVGMRLQLMKGVRDVQQGKDPQHVIRDPEKNSFPNLVVWRGVVPASFDWREVRRRVAEGKSVEGALT